LEEGEDIQEVSERARKNRAGRLRDAEISNRGTPVSDIIEGGRGRKSKKGKAKGADHDSNPGSKRKRGMKSMSVTPSINGDDDDEPDTVRYFIPLCHYIITLYLPAALT
jgi:ATP-dependent helicase STH1/SNF2